MSLYDTNLETLRDKAPLMVILGELDWEEVNPPEIVWFQPRGFSHKEDIDKRDKNEFLRLLRFERILIIQLNFTPRDEIGLAESYHGTGASDNYLGTIKTNSIGDSYNVIEKLSKLLIEYPKVNNNPQFKPYSTINVGDISHKQFRAEWLLEFTITAKKSGKELRYV